MMGLHELDNYLELVEALDKLVRVHLDYTPLDFATVNARSILTIEASVCYGLFDIKDGA